MLERAVRSRISPISAPMTSCAFALDMVTDSAASALGLDSPTVSSLGAPADFVAVEAGSLAEAVAAHPRRKLVIKAGRIVAKDGVLVP